MVALGTAVILTFLAVTAFALYRVVTHKIEATRLWVLTSQQALKADVARVTRESANTKIMAKSAVYTAQRAEENVRNQKPIVLVVPAAQREADDTKPVTIIECAAEEDSEKS